MKSLKFYTALSELGEFRCERDLRRFNNKARRNRRMDQELYLSNFGYCPNGKHNCGFRLFDSAVSEFQVVAYQRSAVLEDGSTVRARSGSFDYWGRGRRWNPNTKKKK